MEKALKQIFDFYIFWYRSPINPLPENVFFDILFQKA